MATKIFLSKLFKIFFKKVLTEDEKSSIIKKYQAEHMKIKLYEICIISNVSTIKKHKKKLLIFLLKKIKKYFKKTIDKAK